MSQQSNASRAPNPATPIQSHDPSVAATTAETDISKDPWDDEIGEIPWDEDAEESGAAPGQVPGHAVDNTPTPGAQAHFNAQAQGPHALETTQVAPSQANYSSEQVTSNSVPSQFVPDHSNHHDWPDHESGPDPWDQQEDLDLEWDGHETTHVDEDLDVESPQADVGQSLHTEMDEPTNLQSLQGEYEHHIADETQGQGHEELDWNHQNDPIQQNIGPYEPQLNDPYEQQGEEPNHEQQENAYQQPEDDFWQNDHDLYQDEHKDNIPVEYPVYTEERMGSEHQNELDYQNAPPAGQNEFETVEYHQNMENNDMNHDLNSNPNGHIHDSTGVHEFQSEQLHNTQLNNSDSWNYPQTESARETTDSGFEEIVNNFEKFNVHDNGEFHQETPQNYEQDVHAQHLHPEHHLRANHQEEGHFHQEHEQFNQEHDNFYEEHEKEQAQSEQEQYQEQSQDHQQHSHGFSESYNQLDIHQEHQTIQYEHNSEQVEKDFWHKDVVTESHLLQETMSRKYTLDTVSHENNPEGGLNIDYENERLNLQAQEPNETVIHSPIRHDNDLYAVPHVDQEQANEVPVEDKLAELQLLDLDDDFLLDDEFLDDEFLDESPPAEEYKVEEKPVAPEVKHAPKKLYVPVNTQPQVPTTGPSSYASQYAPQQNNMSFNPNTYAPNIYAPNNYPTNSYAPNIVLPSQNNFGSSFGPPQHSIAESLELKKLETEKKKNDAYDFPDGFVKPVKPVTRMKLIPQIHGHEPAITSPQAANSQLLQTPLNAPPAKKPEQKQEFFGDLVGPKAPPAKRPAPVKVLEQAKPMEAPVVSHTAPKQPHNPYATLPSRAAPLVPLPNVYQPNQAMNVNQPPMNISQPPMNVSQPPMNVQGPPNPYMPQQPPMNRPMNQLPMANIQLPSMNAHPPTIPPGPTSGPPRQVAGYPTNPSITSPTTLNNQTPAFAQPQRAGQYTPGTQQMLSPSTAQGRFQAGVNIQGSQPAHGPQVPFPSVLNHAKGGRILETKTLDPYIPRAGPYGPLSHSRKSSMMAGGKGYAPSNVGGPIGNGPLGASNPRRSTLERTYPGQKHPETFQVDPNARLIKQIPVFTWSATDLVVSAVPHMNQLHGYSTGIKISKVTELTTKFDTYNDFPGPLSKSKTKKKDLEQWLDRHTEKLRLSGANQDETLVAQILLVLLRQDGAFLAAPTQKALAVVLAPHVDFSPENGGIMNSVLAHAPNAYKLDAMGSSIVWNFIQSGNSKAALDFALSKEDWPLAIIIAQSLGPAAFMTVCSDFARRMYPVQLSHGTKAQHMMPILMKLFVGNVKGIIDEFVQFKSEGEFAQKFYREIVAAAIVNGATLEFLVEFGKYLKDNMMICASEICFMIAGIVPSRTPLANGAIFASVGTTTQTSVYTEIYEYIVASSPVTPSAMLANVFVHTLPIKIKRAQELADLGNFAAARRYCDFIGSTLRALGKTPIVSPQAADEFQKLVVRLSECSSGENSWLGSTLTKVNLDGMWGTIDKLIGGESSSAKPEKGVFSNFSPSISRNASQLDISQIPVPGQRTEMHMPQNVPSSAGTSGVSSPQHRFAQTNRYAPAVSSGNILQNVTQPSIDSLNRVNDQMNRVGAPNIRPGQPGRLASGIDVTALSDPNKGPYHPSQQLNVSSQLQHLQHQSQPLPRQAIGENGSLPLPPSVRPNVASRNLKNSRVNLVNPHADLHDPLAQTFRNQLQFKRDSVGSILSTGSGPRISIKGHSRVSSLQSESHAQTITRPVQEPTPIQEQKEPKVEVVQQVLQIPPQHQSVQQNVQSMQQNVHQQASNSDVPAVPQNNAPPQPLPPQTKPIQKAPEAVQDLPVEGVAEKQNEEVGAPPPKAVEPVAAPPAPSANKPSTSDYPDLLPTRRKPLRAPRAAGKGNPYAPPGETNKYAPPNVQLSTEMETGQVETNQEETPEEPLSKDKDLSADTKPSGSVTDTQVKLETHETQPEALSVEARPESLLNPPLQTLVAPILQSLETQELPAGPQESEPENKAQSEESTPAPPTIAKAPEGPAPIAPPTKIYAPPGARKTQPNPYGPPQVTPVLNPYAPKKAARSYAPETGVLDAENTVEKNVPAPDKDKMAAANLDISFDNGADVAEETNTVPARGPLMLNPGYAQMPNAYLNPYNMGSKPGRTDTALDDFPIPQSPDYTSRANSIIGQPGLYSSKLSQHGTFHQEYQVKDDVVSGYISAGEEDEDDIPVPKKKTEQENKKPEKNLTTKKSLFKIFGGDKDDGRPKATKANLGKPNSFTYDEKLKKWIDKSRPLEEQLKDDEPPPPPMKKPVTSTPAAVNDGQLPPQGVSTPVPSRDAPRAALPPVTSGPSTLDDLIQAKAPRRKARRNYVNELQKH